MPAKNQSDTRHRTDVAVPRATWEALEREVLHPMSADDPTSYALVMDGTHLRKHSTALRYPLDEAKGRAAAEWMRFTCQRLGHAERFTVPPGLREKQSVFRRIAHELDVALRREVGA